MQKNRDILSIIGLSIILDRPFQEKTKFSIEFTRGLIGYKSRPYMFIAQQRSLELSQIFSLILTNSKDKKKLNLNLLIFNKKYSCQINSQQAFVQTKLSVESRTFSFKFQVKITNPSAVPLKQPVQSLIEKIPPMQKNQQQKNVSLSGPQKQESHITWQTSIDLHIRLKELKDFNREMRSRCDNLQAVLEQNQRELKQLRQSYRQPGAQRQKLKESSSILQNEYEQLKDMNIQLSFQIQEQQDQIRFMDQLIKSEEKGYQLEQKQFDCRLKELLRLKQNLCGLYQYAFQTKNKQLLQWVTNSIDNHEIIET